MLRGTRINAAPSAYKPYALALQSRFRWRHKDSDPWRRLMDASCFVVDWITRPGGRTLSQYGGHWCHIVTCAHVLNPWDYPNFYPPVGRTRFVSKITMSDCLTQLRVPSMQGDIIYRSFVSQQQFFNHSNPRFDLSVAHAEQNFKKSGEMKLLWLQNEGYIQRPRLDVLNPLEVGEYVWIYGTVARSDVFDEEAPVDPAMIPTAVKCRVKHLEEEHFFLDTRVVPDAHEVTMGMCGSPIIRNGQCVGMLTATVHEDSENKTLAGTAMCTYSKDIRAFLIEVEKQMKNPPPTQNEQETQFAQRRRAEGNPRETHHDWDDRPDRLARHVKVPSSLWKMDQNWMSEEDGLNNSIFGRTGPFSQDAQETSFGLTMEESRGDGTAPDGLGGAYNPDGDKHQETGMRTDTGPSNTYTDSDFSKQSIWDTRTGHDVKDFMNTAVTDQEAGTMNQLRRSMETMAALKAQEEAQKQAFEAKGDPRQRTAEDDKVEEERKQRHEQRKRPFGGDAELDGLWGQH